MRPQHRQFLSYVLLATYAGISLLGDGLHSLLPEGEHHHHHHGLYVVGHACGDSHHEHHVCEAAIDDEAAETSLTAADCDTDSHVCEICAFLYQAVSQPVEVAEPIEWQPLIVAADADPEHVYSSTTLGPQAARGPPSFMA